MKAGVLRLWGGLLNGSVVALLTISVEWWTFSESEGQIRQLSSFGGRLNRDIQPFSSVRYACAFIRAYLKVNMALSRGLMPTVFVHQASKTGCYPCSTLLRRPPDEEKWRTRVSDCLNVNLAKNIGESMRERSGAAWIICVMLILFEVARVRCWYCLTWRVYDVGTVWMCAAWALLVPNELRARCRRWSECGIGRRTCAMQAFEHVRHLMGAYTVPANDAERKA